MQAGRVWWTGLIGVEVCHLLYWRTGPYRRTHSGPTLCTVLSPKSQDKFDLHRQPGNGTPYFYGSENGCKSTSCCSDTGRVLSCHLVPMRDRHGGLGLDDASLCCWCHVTVRADSAFGLTLGGVVSVSFPCFGCPRDGGYRMRAGLKCEHSSLTQGCTGREGTSEAAPEAVR